MHPREFDVGLDEASIAQLGERVGAGETMTFETRPSAQGRNRVSGRDPRPHIPAGRSSTSPGARARHQRAQARRGDAAGKGRRAADGPDGACSRVAADDAGRADHLDRPRGEPAPGRDGRERRGMRALARSRPARDGGSALGARQHRRRRQAGARSHRADPGAHEAAGAAHGFARPQPQDSRSARVHGAGAAQPRHRAPGRSSTGRCRT